MPSKHEKQSLRLKASRKAKQDEFYTCLEDIEKELKYYRHHFKDKVVLCNCDDPYVSKFFHYFSFNFEFLKIKELLTTCYKSNDIHLFTQNRDQRAMSLKYDGSNHNNRVPHPDEIGIELLKEDGDFRSDECIELLKRADIVSTNPPFSLFR